MDKNVFCDLPFMSMSMVHAIFVRSFLGLINFPLYEIVRHCDTIYCEILTSDEDERMKPASMW